MFGSPVVERLSADDLVSLAEDRGTVPLQPGLVLMLRAGADFSPDSVLRALDARVAGTPRLRQRLVRVPPWLGRPFWADDPDFSIHRHVGVVECTGGPEAALALADELVAIPLPWDRPLWAARVVVGLDARSAALIFVSHHVLADGVSGMELLRRLTDAAPPPPNYSAFPRPIPSRPQLLADAALGFLHGVRLVPAVAGHLRDGLRILRAVRGTLIVRTSLNRPTGRRRRSLTLSCDVARARAVAHAAGATVNDLWLTAVAAALGDLLAGRGEQVDELVIAVLFSTRSADAASQPSNRSGSVPITVPVTGPLTDRLKTVAARTHAAKQQPRAAANTLIGSGTRLFARLGMFGWVANHQRFFHTLASGLRAPLDHLTVAGYVVTGITVLPVANGNVTVMFASLEYGGCLTTTIMADPVACPDAELLRDQLAAALETLLSSTSGPDTPPKGADRGP